MSEDKNEMPQAAELKSCPFCGGKPYVIEDDSYGKCSIGCNCEAEPSVFRHTYEMDQCIAAWNRRSPPSPSERDEIRREALEEAAIVVMKIDGNRIQHGPFHFGPTVIPRRATAEAIRALSEKET